MSVLAGIRDVNLEILSKLDDDRDLFNFCLANKESSKLCQDQNFWRKRFEKKFGKEAMKYKPAKRNWKNHYLKVVYDLEEYSKYPQDFFEDLSWRISNQPNPRTIINVKDSNSTGMLSKIANSPERLKNQYWLLNLGNEITIQYPIDRYDELELYGKTYKAPEGKYFTPHQVLTLVYNFYQEKITPDELEDLQEAEVEYSDDFTTEQAERGEVKRIDLMGDRQFFEGFVREPGTTVYMLELGS